MVNESELQMNLVWQDDVEWWEYEIKHAKRFGWAAIWDVVVWLILAALGPEFLSLDPRLSVWPHVEEWDSHRLTNLFRPSMSYLVRAFHLAYASEMFGTSWKREEVHHIGMQPRLIEADSSGKPTSPCNEQFCIGERPSCDGGLELFGVAHGIGWHEVKVVGDHHSASISRNDIMWLWRRSSRVGKVVHPCRVKSFRKAMSTVMDDLETDAWS
jgi:hypothetical protein